MPEKNTQENSAQKYITETRAEARPQKTKKETPAEQRIIDEDTERTLVSVISAALAAVPAGMIIGRMLPDMPVYNIYQYFQP